MHDTPKIDDLNLVAILQALSDETRLQIIEYLAAGQELPCKSCSPDVPKSSLSHHFQVLRSSGVIASRKEGTTLLNSLRRADIERRFPGLLTSVLSARTIK